MILQNAARSDVGRRRSANEDRFSVAADLGFYMVADGMGGHAAGQRASELAAESALDAVRQLDGSEAGLSERLRAAIARANREVHSASMEDPDLAGMGTTAVALLVAGERAALGHVGDSRAYLLRGGSLRQLTHDHSVVGELMRRRQITEQAARTHPHRHVLTRALGVRESVAPDLIELALVPGDLFLLCSDGLTTHVEDPEIADLLLRTDDIGRACTSLVDLANDRGGEDNVTVLVTRCEKE